MSYIMEMINRHPKNFSEPERNALSDAIESCINCGQACVACSDACLGEKDLEKFRSVIRSTSDSGDLCLTTAKILSRLNDRNFRTLRSIATTCIEQVRETSVRCNEHAQHHEHCRVCYDACRACENTLSEYVKFLE